MSSNSYRPNFRQTERFVEFLEKNPGLAKGLMKSAQGRQETKRKWASLAITLNSMGGSTGGAIKDGPGWSKFWSEKKCYLKKVTAREALSMRHSGGGPSDEIPKLSQLEQRLVEVLGGKQFATATSASNESKLKKGEDMVFSMVKQACVDLVKKHGHSVSLFDEEGFRTILQLLPMTAKQTATITSEYIQKYLDLTREEDETPMSRQDDQEASENDYEPTERIEPMKSEIHEECACNCDARAIEDSTKGHEFGCPAAAQQPYWNYFEVTTDEATCQICSLTLNWSNITKLKEHLVEKHPTAEFVDDGAEFTRGPASDVWSQEDAEEIYLEEDLDGDPLPTPTANKRRRTSELFKSTDDRTPGLRESREKSRAERMTEMRAEREGLSAASRRVIELAPDRFKSLDSFGQYVAELMKLIPKEKCLKYQVQIVQRLLQEQAAAG